MAKISNARMRANRKYDKKAYDKKLILIPKGTLEQLKEKATADGVSLNRYILEALEARSGLKLVLDGDGEQKNELNTEK